MGVDRHEFSGIRSMGTRSSINGIINKKSPALHLVVLGTGLIIGRVRMAYQTQTGLDLKIVLQEFFQLIGCEILADNYPVVVQ